MRMPFGKFRGKEIEELPSAYLHWLAENCDNDAIATEADREWRWRDEFGVHWKYDED